MTLHCWARLVNDCVYALLCQLCAFVRSIICRINICVDSVETLTFVLATKGQIPLRYPGCRHRLQRGRRPVASWNLAYHTLSSELADLRPARQLIADLVSDLSQTGVELMEPGRRPVHSRSASWLQAC